MFFSVFDSFRLRVIFGVWVTLLRVFLAKIGVVRTLDTKKVRITVHLSFKKKRKKVVFSRPYMLVYRILFSMFL